MTSIEMYNVCKLLFPDKEIELYVNTVHIWWNAKNTHVQHNYDRHMWIQNLGSYFRIDSNMIRLPSWFKRIVKYETNKAGEKVFKGFNV